MVDIVSILKNYISLDCIIDYQENCPYICVSYGIIIERRGQYLQPKGFTHQKTSAWGGDYFNAHIMATSYDTLFELESALIKVSQDFQGDSDYSRIDFDLDRIKDEVIGRVLYHRELTILAQKNNRDLY